MVPGTIVLVLLSTFVYSRAQNIWITTSCPADSSAEILLPHEDDCTKYYLCTKGQKVLKQCPEETSFHMGLQGCEWSQDVICQRDTTVQAPKLLEIIEQRLTTDSGYLSNGCPSDPIIELLLPHKSDCSKYYQCTHGIKLERPCPATLHFDVVAQTCTYPNIANCTLSSQPIQNTPELTKTTLRPKTTEDTEKMNKFDFLPNGCPAEMHSYFLIAHESECKKYYQCNHGKKELKECPADLHFDFSVQGCNWSNIAKCHINYTPVLHYEAKPLLIQTTESTTTKSNYLPNGCPKDLHIHQLLPHETDCTKFYQCNHGDKALKQCPAGLHFDVSYQVCNWPEAANCYIDEPPIIEVIRTTEKEHYTTTDYGTDNGIITTQTVGYNSTTNYVPTRPTTKLPEITTNLPVTSPKPTTEKSELTTWYDWTTEGATENPETETEIDFYETETTDNYYETTVENESTTNFYVPTIRYPTTREDTTSEVIVTRTEPPTTIRPTVTHSPPTYPPTTEEPTTTYKPTTTYRPTPNKPTTTYKPSTITEPTTTQPTTTYKPTTRTEPTITQPTPTHKPTITTEPTITQPTTTYKPTTTREPTITQPTTTHKPTITTEPTITQPTTYKPTTTTEPTNTNVPTTTNTPITEFVSTTIQNIETTEDYKTTEDYEPTVVTTKGPQTTYVTPGPSPCLPGFFGNMAHPELCNAYYLCSAGLAIPLFCPNGYEFDPDGKICTPIKPGGCTLGEDGTYTTQDPIHTEDSNDDKVTETTPEFMTTTTKPTTEVVTIASVTTTTTSSPTMPEMIVTIDYPTTIGQPVVSCPPGVIELVPYPGECTLYYMCFGGSALEMHCPVGLEYDFNSKACVPIQEGGCTLGGNTTPTKSTTTDAYIDINEADITTFVPTIFTIPTTTENVTTTKEPAKPAICPPGATASMPNPAKCNLYYLCTGGMAIGPLYCPTGQEFDFETKSCTAIKEGGCTLSGSSTPDSMTSETDYDETTTQSHTQTESVTGPLWNLPGFPELPITNAPDTVGTQASTTELIEIAVTTQTVSEITEKVPETTEKVLGTTEKVPETTEKVPKTTEEVPKTTAKVPQTTETTEIQFIITTNVPTTTENIQETTQLCPPTAIVNVPHPEICDAYYLCFSGSAIAMYCPPGQEFDPISKACVTIKDGGCTYNHAILTTIPTEMTPKIYTEDERIEANERIPVTETHVQETTELPRITVKEPVQKTICGPNDFGHKPHPEMCNAFYMCTGGTAIPLLCAEGLEFDTNSGLCEEIREGGCTYKRSSSLLITQDNLTTTQPDSTTTKTAEISKNIIRSICNVTDFGYVPHPDKCDAYYMCTGGIAVPLKCQKGYEFNFNKRKCILITTGGCFSRKFFYKRTPHFKRQTLILNSWHQ